ncbi:MAG: FKBP-type peptidyl-prolyl cis-trans isomerase [Breznakibacter sp.]
MAQLLKLIQNPFMPLRAMALITLLISSICSSAQHIPEEVRIKQYINKYHPGALPLKNGLYVIKTKISQGPEVKPDKDVTVHYEGKLLNLRVFDSSYERGMPITFRLGEGRVIAGWEQGVPMLREGETAVLVIPSHLGYGDRAVGKIPPNSPLVFKLEVVKAAQ